MKKENAEIKFPCTWEFRLIVDAPETESVLASINSLDAREKCGFQTVSGEASKGGKYASLRISCVVDSRERAKELAAALGALPGVKFMI